MRRWLAVGVLALLGLSLAGCSALSGGSSELPDDDVRTELNELRRQTAMNEVEITRLRHQLHRLEAALAEGGRQIASIEPVRVAAPGESLSRSGGSMSAASSPPAQPERVKVEVPGPGSVSKIEVSELEEEAPVVEVAPVWTEEPPSAATPAVVEAPLVERSAPKPSLGAVDAEARQIYDEAYTLYHQGAYAEAEARFLDFLTLGPGNELSDNAVFWVGSTRYARGDYPGALRAFRETVETYPGQNKVPDALFKIGQCLERIGDRESAETVYEELKKRFPETAAAALAEQRLSNP